ncbi:uncharacterized protein LTR77_002524 [Saxophila tyrrhenica]|uniref:N-acetylgalactosaminide beta-1,3-galactosyltransferase n=1 Tax=Saxophila tyrrhenica TaxID=1690608 RepID=A0AAV9PNM7_9PEZI|nr:hypothetical protein LTR77_002524 [Saxophila tyrrhenica]
MAVISFGHHWKAWTVTLLFYVYTPSHEPVYVPEVDSSQSPEKVDSGQTPDIDYASPRRTERVLPDFCDAFDVSKIAISIKTGATEPRNKIPTQLMTFLRCIPDVMLFSDLEQSIGAHKLEDVLSSFSEASMQNNVDFDLYRKQQEYAKQGRETELGNLGEIPIPYDDWRTSGKSAAWGLDKYKFLHMIQRAWERQPNKAWYVFIEADTYLSISNLLRFLDTQDPKQKLYFGNNIRMWEHPTPLDFAHGGSGFILSGATVKAFAAAKTSIARSFTPGRISQWWYGDFVVADALDEELGVKVTGLTPMINSDEPAVLPFDRNVWCKPVITLHHMDARQFDEMYKFQKARNFSELLFRDVYAATAHSNGIPLMGELWDNLSDDERYGLEIRPNDLSRIKGDEENERLRDPNASYEACEAACDQNGHCFQFSHVVKMRQIDEGRPGEQRKCHLSKVFRFGKEVLPAEHEPGTQWTSGWMTERIRRFVDGNRECPDVVWDVI